VATRQHPVLLVEKPRIEFAYDTHSKQSANTRVRVLHMLAANRIPLIAYHFPWPGVGHVAKNGDGFPLLACAAADDGAEGERLPRRRLSSAPSRCCQHPERRRLRRATGERRNVRQAAFPIGRWT